MSEREAIREESGLVHRDRQRSVQVHFLKQQSWLGGGGSLWEMIVKLRKGEMEPALRLSWKECSRLGKPQVYRPGSDNSHNRVVKTAPKVRWQRWQKRFITEDSLSAKDAMFLITLPGRYHRLIPALERGNLHAGRVVQCLTARRRWNQSMSALS